jgi:hypothetical protein
VLLLGVVPSVTSRVGNPPAPPTLLARTDDVIE